VTTRRSVKLPESLPVLDRGSHVHPGDGACFMEYASILAGERFSDRPGCTHPVLAAVARAVNDAVGSASRQRLVELVPEVVGIRRDDPRTGPLLVALCTERALSLQPRHRACFANGCGTSRCAHRQWLRAAGARAGRRLAAVERTQALMADSGPVAYRLRRARERVRRHVYDASAEHVINLAVCVVARCSEDEAVRLLRACIVAAQGGATRTGRAATVEPASRPLVMTP
jgi:hypothetical protein